MLVEHLMFLLHAAALEPLVAAIDPHRDHVVLRHHGLEREPPHLADTVGEARRDIDGERHVVVLEDRISELVRIAIAIVECDADETAGEIALGHAAVQFVERNEIDAGTAQLSDDALEELRCDFEQPIGLEAVGPRRTDMMQRQDGADAAQHRP